MKWCQFIVSNPSDKQPDVNDKDTKNKELDPSAPASLAQVGQMFKNAQADFNDALNKRDEQLNQRLNQVAALSLDTAEKFNALLQRLDNGGAKAAPQQGGGGITSLAEKLGIPQEVVDNVLAKVIDKYMPGEAAPENDRLLQLLKVGAERELKNTLLLGIKRNVRRGMLMPEEVEEVLGERIDKMVTGGPIKVD